jgi:hypothetical protein
LNCDKRAKKSLVGIWIKQNDNVKLHKNEAIHYSDPR